MIVYMSIMIYKTCFDIYKAMGLENGLDRGWMKGL